MPTNPPKIKIGRVPFAEAIQYFRDKVNLPTEKWDDLEKGMHARAFTVAGATRDDVLSALREMVDKAIADGISIQEFRKQFKEIVGKTGWTGWAGEGSKEGIAWRTKVIYQTNLRTAYSAGRYAQMKEMQETHPYWVYRHGGSLEPRPHHLVLDGKAFRADDPFWDIHYPPNGWGCSCYVVAKSLAGLKRMGKVLEDGKPDLSVMPPNSVKIDKGWDYNPGEAAFGSWDREKHDFTMLQEGAYKTYAELGRGAVPDDLAVAQKGNVVTNKQDLVEVIKRDVLDGADEKLFTPIEMPNMTIMVNAERLATHYVEDKIRDGRQPTYDRSIFLPFLKETIENPFEIWAQFFRAPSGKVFMRYTFIKGINYGKKKGLIFIAQVLRGQIIEMSFYPKDLKEFNVDPDKRHSDRRGILLYGREEREA